MTAADTKSLGTVLLLGVGAYFLYKTLEPLLSGIGSGAAAAVDSGTSAIANLFPGTSPSVQVQGTVNLPNGLTAPISSLQSNGFNADGSLNMSDASGNTYAVTSLGNGTYQAN
jgi:hypothetical protein